MERTLFQIDLSNRVAAITGGSSGIGLATAQLFMEAGAAVSICGRDATRLEAAVVELRDRFPGGKIYAHKADVTDSAQMLGFAAATQQAFGGLDTLVNNAGQGRVSTFADTSDANWREEIDLKLFSLIHPTRAFLPMLERSNAAAIVCVNSLLALQPEPHMVATSAARAAALSLMHSMATEFSPKGVRVNAILLGLVDSGQWRRRYAARKESDLSWEQWSLELAQRKGIRMGRLGTPEEAAKAILFLGTNLSSYTTGTSIDVSGGLAKHI